MSAPNDEIAEEQVTEMFAKAIGEDDATELEQLFKRWPTMANPNTICIWGFSMLGGAIVKAAKKCFEFLLKHAKIDVGVRDRCLRTPLHHAAEPGDPFFLQTLLNDTRLEDVNPQDIFGHTPLHNAIWESEHLELLLDAPRIDPNIQDIDEQTPLEYSEWLKTEGHVSHEQHAAVHAELLRWDASDFAARQGLGLKMEQAGPGTQEYSVWGLVNEFAGYS